MMKEFLFLNINLILFFSLAAQASSNSEVFTENRDFIVTNTGILPVHNSKKYNLQIMNSGEAYLSPEYYLKRQRNPNGDWFIVEVERSKFSEAGKAQIAKFSKNGAVSLTQCLAEDDKQGLVGMTGGRNVKVSNCVTANETVCSTFANGVGSYDYLATTVQIEKFDAISKSQEAMKEVMSQSGYKEMVAENVAQLSRDYSKLALSNLNEIQKVLSSQKFEGKPTIPKGEADQKSDKILFQNLAWTCGKWWALTQNKFKVPNPELMQEARLAPAPTPAAK